MARLSVPFTITVTGEETGETFVGRFSAKNRITFREELNRDKIRRELVGEFGNSASERAALYAIMFAELAVRITESPDWWKASGGGLDLIDENVVLEVYKQAMKIEEDERKAIKKKGEDAEAELKKIHESNNLP